MAAAPQSLRCARAVLPAASLLCPFSLPARRYRQLDLKQLKYKDILAMIGSCFGLKLKFLPDSRDVREVREPAPGLRRERHGLRDRGGLHLTQVAGDVVAGEDFAHCRLFFRAALEGVGAAGVEA